MSENELRASRYIENFIPPNIIEKSVHQVCGSVVDAFLGQIEYGRDYVISTELTKEDWADGFGMKYTYNLKFDELVRCRDCVHYTEDEAEYYHYCNEWCGNVEPDKFCAWGERREG